MAAATAAATSSARAVLVDPQLGNSPLALHSDAPEDPVSLVLFTHVAVFDVDLLHQVLVLLPLLHREVGDNTDVVEVVALTQVLGGLEDPVLDLSGLEVDTEGARFLAHIFLKFTNPEGELYVRARVSLNIHVVEELLDGGEVNVPSGPALDRERGLIEAMENNTILFILALPELGTHALRGFSNDAASVLLSVLLDLLYVLGDLVNLVVGLFGARGGGGHLPPEVCHVPLVGHHPLSERHVGPGTPVTGPPVVASGVVGVPEVLQGLRHEVGAPGVAPAVALRALDTPQPLLHLHPLFTLNTFRIDHSEKSEYLWSVRERERVQLKSADH